MINRTKNFLQDIYDKSRRLNKEMLEFAGATQKFGEAAQKSDSYRASMLEDFKSVVIDLDETFKVDGVSLKYKDFIME